MESLRYQLKGFGYATSLSSSFWKVLFVVLEKNLFSNNLMIFGDGDKNQLWWSDSSISLILKQLLVTQNTNIDFNIILAYILPFSGLNLPDILSMLVFQ